MTIQYLDQPYELIDKPLAWQKRGLQQTATGYGAKLTSRRVVKLADGRKRRVYVTCYSNAGSAWIMFVRARLMDFAARLDLAVRRERRKGSRVSP